MATPMSFKTGYHCGDYLKKPHRAEISAFSASGTSKLPKSFSAGQLPGARLAPLGAPPAARQPPSPSPLRECEGSPLQPWARRPTREIGPQPSNRSEAALLALELSQAIGDL